MLVAEVATEAGAMDVAVDLATIVAAIGTAAAAVLAGVGLARSNKAASQSRQDALDARAELREERERNRVREELARLRGIYASLISSAIRWEAMHNAVDHAEVQTMLSLLPPGRAPALRAHFGIDPPEGAVASSIGIAIKEARSEMSELRLPGSPLGDFTRATEPRPASDR